MHLGQQADALLVHERADHPVDLRMQALGRFPRCLLHGFLHTYGNDAFGQIHTASLELCHGGSLQIYDLDDVQREPGVLLREAHGLVKRRASGIGPIERDHNGIVEHCNPLLSPVEPGKEGDTVRCDGHRTPRHGRTSPATARVSPRVARVPQAAEATQRTNAASPSPSGFIPSIARSPAAIAAGLPQTPFAQTALPCCNVSRTRCKEANRPVHVKRGLSPATPPGA